MLKFILTCLLVITVIGNPALADGTSRTTRTLSLTGTVTDESGAPLEGASIEIVSYDFAGGKGKTAHVIAGTSSTHTGTYHLSLETSDQVPVMRAGKPGYTSLLLMIYEVAAPGFDETEPISRPIVLTRAAPVSGRVVNADGEGIGDVQIVASPRKRLAEGIMYNPGQTGTGADGSFSLDTLPAGPFQLVIFPPDSPGVQQLATAPVTDLVTTLSVASSSISGHILNYHTDKPVSDANVTLQRRFVTENGWTADRSFDRTVATDDAGAFTFPDLVPGTYGFHVEAEGLTVLITDTPPNGVLLEENQQADVSIVMYKGLIVRGSVVDGETSEPVAGAELVQETGFGQAAATVISGEDGSYELPPRALTGAGDTVHMKLLVRAPGYVIDPKMEQYYLSRQQESVGNVTAYSDHEISIAVPRDVPEYSQDIRLVRAREINGLVTDHEGAPVSGAYIHVDTTFHRDKPAVIKTDELGKFEITAGNKKNLRVFAAKEGFAIGSQPLPLSEDGATSTVLIKLRRPAELSGIVLGPDNQPLIGAEISFALQGAGDGINFSNNYGRFVSDKDGTFQIDNLQPGRYKVSARKQGYAAGDHVTVELEPGDGNPAVTIRLEKSYSISGRVLDHSSKPVSGATVTAHKPASHDSGPSSEIQTTASFHRMPHTPLLSGSRTAMDGTFELRDLPAGAVDIMVRGKDMTGGGNMHGVNSGSTGLEIRIAPVPAQNRLHFFPATGGPSGLHPR